MFGVSNLKYKAFSIGALGALSVMLPAGPALAASGNGGGYNGPSLNSQSIPVMLDRGITSKSAGEAIRVCLVDGDRQRGITSQFNKILNAASVKGPLNYAASEFKPVLYSKSVAQESSLLLYSANGVDRVQYAKVKSWASSEDGYFVLTFSGEAIGLGNDFDTVRLTVEGGLPRVAFGSIIKDSGYDDYGREIWMEKVLRDVSIELPANYGSAVPLVNVDTGKPTRLKFNEVEYVQCLQSEFQARAE